MASRPIKSPSSVTAAVPATESPETFKLEVAANLRRLRTKQGWSLGELSRRAGVSSAMLSQVETGKTTPTIAVLWKIAAGFAVPFAELLHKSADVSDVVVTHTGPKAMATADRTFRSTPLVPAGTMDGVELY